MTRCTRIRSETGFYHVMARGVAKQIIFEDDQDRIVFLRLIRQALAEFNFTLFAFCLMDNHVHLLLEDSEMQISSIMKKILQRYSKYYNEKNERVGHLFGDRFKSEPIRNDTQFKCALRYIIRNPIKAGMIDNVFYMWSSIREYDEENIINGADFVNEMFGGYKALLSFLEIDASDNFIEIDDGNRITDAKAIIIAKELCDVPNMMKVSEFQREKRNKTLKMLHENGLSIRQLSRLTGISKNTVLKVIKK